MITWISCLLIQKEDYESRTLVSPTHCTLELQEQLLIMLQMENTNFAFSQEKTSVVHADLTPLKQDITSFMTVENSRKIGIQVEKLFLNSYHF